jgi:hypothetical protein
LGDYLLRIALAATRAAANKKTMTNAPTTLLAVLSFDGRGGMVVLGGGSLLS